MTNELPKNYNPAEFEDRLVGFGYDYYRKNVMLPDWDRQKLKVRERGK